MKKTRQKRLGISDRTKLSIRSETLKLLVDVQLQGVVAASGQVHTCSSEDVICDPP